MIASFRSIHKKNKLSLWEKLGEIWFFSLSRLSFMISHDECFCDEINWICFSILHKCAYISIYNFSRCMSSSFILSLDFAWSSDLRLSVVLLFISLYLPINVRLMCTWIRNYTVWVQMCRCEFLCISPADYYFVSLCRFWLILWVSFLLYSSFFVPNDIAIAFCFLYQRRFVLGTPYFFFCRLCKAQIYLQERHTEI